MIKKHKSRISTGILLIILITITFILFKLAKRLENPEKVNIGFTAIQADVDGNGTVNILDFQLLSNAFGTLPGNPKYDPDCNFDNEPVINVLDFQLLSNNFGTTETTGSPTIRPATPTHGAHPTSPPVDGEPPLLPPPNHKENIGGSNQIRCESGKILSDDPIVYPNQPGASHEHLFFGNNGVTAFSTYSQLLTQGTGCDNKNDTAAYWVPSLFLPDGKKVRPRQVRAYYYPHTQNKSTLQVFPPDLRIIAGDRNASKPQAVGIVDWLCRDRASQSAGHRLVTIDPPTCRPDQYLSLSLRFPDCLARKANGEPMLDSSDHRRHMAYADATGKCPASHPIKVPKLRISIVYEHPTFYGGDFTLGGFGNDPKKLSRHGMHADFWNTWNQAGLEQLVRGL